MANTRSAKKRIRQTERRTLHNKMIRSRFRTAIRRFREAVAAGDLERVKAAFARATSLLDKAAKVGVIHPNAAARRKSRLARDLARAQGA